MNGSGSYYCPRCRWHYDWPRPVLCKVRGKWHGAELCDGCATKVKRQNRRSKK